MTGTRWPVFMHAERALMNVCVPTVFSGLYPLHAPKFRFSRNGGPIAPYLVHI